MGEKTKSESSKRSKLPAYGMARWKLAALSAAAAGTLILAGKHLQQIQPHLPQTPVEISRPATEKPKVTTPAESLPQPQTEDEAYAQAQHAYKTLAEATHEIMESTQAYRQNPTRKRLEDIISKYPMPATQKRLLELKARLKLANQTLEKTIKPSKAEKESMGGPNQMKWINWPLRPAI